MPRLTLQLVTFNGARYIPFLFESLRRQTFLDWELIVIDNASSDDTVECIEYELKNFSFSYRFVKNTENVGFAKAHNQAFAMATSEYVALLNQDLYLTSNCLGELVRELGAASEVAVVAPCLMRWDFNASCVRLANGFTEIIDSLGLRVFKNRRVVEIGAGQKWDKSLQARLMPVFGVSGALPLFRRSALQATILPSGQVFDESYVMYKEDVDLAFRLRQAGFKACVVEQTVAYHDRTAHHGSNLSDFSALKGKRQQSDFIAYHSYKNHLATLYTNEYFQNFILDFPFIVWYEIKKFGYFLLFNPSILKGLWQLWKARKELRKKRAAVKIARKVSGKELRRWFI